MCSRALLKPARATRLPGGALLRAPQRLANVNTYSALAPHKSPRNLLCCLREAMKVFLQYGQQAALVDVQSDTPLGAMQKMLCRIFGQRFPVKKATLTTQGHTFDEFAQQPFSSCSEGVSLEVKFCDTDDPFFYDLLDRNPRHHWLR